VANPEHLSILKQGVEAWNIWRRKNPLIRPELNGYMLEHDLRFNMAYGTRDLMDWQYDAEERKKCYEALKDGSIHYDSYWEDCWSIRNLRGIDFESADLSNAELILSDLSEANLKSADLRAANLRGAVLKDAALNDANLEGMLLGNTRFANTDLTRAKGLSCCRHFAPSPIDPSTVHKSAKLPEDFLLACGLSPLDILKAEITLPGLAPIHVADIAGKMRKLIERPMGYASCFISHSSKDKAFADQLYDDLRRRGVACWFAPHDIRGGKKIHEQIDEAIRDSDRLLLILSEHSLNSDWVKTEIATARQQEIREKRQMLFPVSLVPYDRIKEWKAFDADTGKDSAREVREYFIPDFSNWKDHDSYQQAFQRLLRDLKADTKTGE
jgi:hypothetical protein